MSDYLGNASIAMEKLIRRVMMAVVLLGAIFIIFSACGCVSRTQYLRDRLQDSLEKQEQRKFNAEVLRKLEEIKERPNWPCYRCDEEPRP